MTKSELIKSISVKYPNLSILDIKKLVDIVFSQISNSLASGNRVEIRGFGTMSTLKRKPRTARNPKTNEAILLNERSVVHFRMGKEFFNRLNPCNSNAS